MRYWLRGKRGGLIGFLAIATLVLGGLGWVTATVLMAALAVSAGQARGQGGVQNSQGGGCRQRGQSTSQPPLTPFRRRRYVIGARRWGSRPS